MALGRCYAYRDDPALRRSRHVHQVGVRKPHVLISYGLRHLE